MGNQIQTDALGIVGDTSDDIVSWADFDNLGDWLWRPVATGTAAPPGFDPVFNATTISYTEQGEVEEQSVIPEEGDEILQVHNEYNAIGQVVLVEEGGVDAAALRRREMAYDEDFSAYLVAEKWRRSSRSAADRSGVARSFSRWTVLTIAAAESPGSCRVSAFTASPKP